MIATAIEFVLTNIPVVMFILALAVAALTNGFPSTAERYLAWMLLLSIGVESVWGGMFHVFLPNVASAQIGWQPSPFEYEVGVSDIGLGIAAIASFWRSLSFKSAIATVTTLFFAGVAIGHFYQAFANHDYSPDNFGIMLVITLLQMVLLPILVWASWHAREETTRRA